VEVIVADSDVLIDALRGREGMAERLAREIEAGTLVTTAIHVFELLAGARKTASRKKVEALLGALPVLPVDEAAGEKAAAVHRTLAAKGSSIGMADCLIAAVCLAQGATLLTRNKAHFGRVPGLALAT
jgi:tRNA(fMet)-specific endonuclease VapC